MHPNPKVFEFEMKHSSLSRTPLSKLAPDPAPQVRAWVRGIKEARISLGNGEHESIFERVSKSLFKEFRNENPLESSDVENRHCVEFQFKKEVRSQEEFVSLLEKLETLIKAENGDCCDVELLYYPAGAIVPQFHELVTC